MSVSFTWEDSEGPLDRRDIDPSFVVLLHPGSSLLPVRIGFTLVGGADEQAADVVLCGDDEQTVVSVASDAAAGFSLAVGLVRGWEPDVMCVSEVSFLCL